MGRKTLLLALLVSMISCKGGIIEPTLYSSHVTGTVTSTSSASVSGLRVVAVIFTVGCDETGGLQGGNSGTTTESGTYSISPTGYEDTLRQMLTRFPK